ncbi:MAG TPA: hypothetical protein VHE78_11605 [Gemmatimonadaceae bacterium]|nr:hypothetical protein [Gemmatimonadaceae bacterium]
MVVIEASISRRPAALPLCATDRLARMDYARTPMVAAGRVSLHLFKRAALKRAPACPWVRVRSDIARGEVE